MSKLLFDQYPLVIDRELAVKLGLNEAIIIQQVHYWTEQNKVANRNLKDGYYWTYNSYVEWQKQFPFWSDHTIRRTINKLEKLGVLVTGVYNKLQIDRTKWYRIDYEMLEKLVTTPCGQNGQTNSPEWTNQKANLDRPLPETITEINSETTINNNRRNFSVTAECVPENSIIKYYLESYEECFGKKHPKLRKEQWERVEKEINEFNEAYFTDLEDMRIVVDQHFESDTLNTDYNINHFATPGIMEINYREAIRAN